MRRRGYTYAELMVVITVIGVLIAMLLPAVQACREAARRSTCSRNIEQLILAVQNYEMHHGVNPPGTMNPDGPIHSQPKGYHHNWIIQTLPFIESQNVYERIDPTVSVYDARHDILRKMQFSILRCPSHANRGPGYSDYAGVHHAFEAPIDVDNNGVFFLNSHIRYEDLWDGSSNTLFIGEKWTPRGDLGWMSGTRATLRNAGSSINVGGAFGGRWPATGGSRYDLEPKTNPLESSNVPGSADYIEDDRMMSMLIGTRDDIGPPVPGVARRRSIPRPKIATLGVGGFSSPHPGGAQFAFGDGSVRYLSEVIDPIAYTYLAHRADGNIQPVDY
jgi:prepilin-type N-terminal cleavage/methylation domain-containing protein/prepilin-type processing-associated H-X9-DG protein